MPFAASPIRIDVKLTQEEIRGLYKPATFAKMMEEDVIREATKFMAFGSMAGLAVLLWPGSVISGVRIGASGGASTNLGVAEMGAGIAGPGHLVYEGAKTPANKFIREGTAPRGKGGKYPPIDKIKEWIRIKGIGGFYDPSPRRPVRMVGNVIQPNIVTRDPIEEIAWAIAGGIKRHGTAMGHRPAYPSGQPRFDYVDYAVIMKNMIEKLYRVLTETEMPKVNSLMVHYLKTGSRQRVNWGSRRVRVL